MVDISLELQKKIYEILLKISLINSKIIADIRTILGKIDNNKALLGYLNDKVASIKLLLEKLEKYLKIDIHQYIEKYTLLKNQLIDIEKDIHKIHVGLTENDGQTNQCVMAITKILLKILKLLAKIGNISTTKLIYLLNPSLFKKACYKIIIAILVFIGTSIFGWIGTKYWDAIKATLINEQKADTPVKVENTQINQNK